MVDQIKFKSLSFIGLAVLIAGLFACCKDEDEDQECFDASNPDCENYDPCYGVMEPTADFFIEDHVFDEVENEWFFYPEGSGPIVGSNVRFRARSSGEEISHYWYIGTDNFDESMVEIDFSEVTRPNTITVLHVIEFPVDSTCYPLSTGRDSVARTFELVHYLHELLTIGNTFRGVINNQTDSFDFKIRALTMDGSEAVYSTDFNSEEFEFYRINMHNDDDSVSMGGATLSNHFLSFGDLSRQGRLEIDSVTHEVLMEYQWTDLEDYVFTGRLVE